MLALTGGYFLVEIVVGYMTNSLALVGDSYHMLSDVIALLVGYASVRVRVSHKTPCGMGTHSQSCAMYFYTLNNITMFFYSKP